MSLDPGHVRTTILWSETSKAEHAHTNYFQQPCFELFFSRNGLFLNDSYTKAATCDETPFSRRIEKILKKLIWRQAGTCVAIWFHSTMVTFPSGSLQRCHAASMVRTRVRWNSWAQRGQIDSSMSLMVLDGLFQTPNFECFSSCRDKGSCNEVKSDTATWFTMYIPWRTITCR